MALTPPAGADAAAEQTARPARGWRRFLDNEPLLYSVTFCVMVAGCLVVPKLLNNMIFVFVVLLLGVAVVPLLLKRGSGAPPSEIDRKGAEH